MKSCVFLTAFFLLAQILRADGVLPAGKFAMPFLQENGTARAMAMGSAYVGVAQGTAALFWNPAGLGGLLHMELGLHHSTGLDNSGKEMLVLGNGFGGFGALAAAVNYSNEGNFEIRDNSGALSGIETAGVMGVSLGWGKTWLGVFSTGICLKAVRQTLEGKDYDTLAGDAGILWAINTSLNMGITYSNLGNKPGNYALASGVRAGFSYHSDIFPANTLLVAVSAESQGSGISRISAGAENTISGMYMLRLGYVVNLAGQELGGITGITAGLGVKIQDITLDYAYVPFGDLGTNHRVSFTYVIP